MPALTFLMGHDIIHISFLLHITNKTNKISIPKHIHRFLVANLNCFEKSYKTVLLNKYGVDNSL